MIKIGAATILTAIVVPLFAVGYNALNRISVIEVKLTNRKEILDDIRDDLKEMKTDIKELIKRR